LDKNRRLLIQSLAALIQNANFKGFFTGEIYKGAAKNVCVPGLNCYSCPGAVGACPIGALQNALSGKGFRFPYYVLGLLIFFGALLGRMICAFLCPFGLLQDLVYRIPFVKKVRTFRGERVLRKLKYAVLIVLVIVLPLCVKLTPFFCKYLCPEGTLSGLLLAFADTKLFSMMGGRFVWKCCVLGMIVLAGIVISRPFCRYLCPLGAFYGLLNPVALTGMETDTARCVACGKCANVCPMGIDPAKDVRSAECIRCGQCISACPKQAISRTFVLKKRGGETEIKENG